MTTSKGFWIWMAEVVPPRDRGRAALLATSCTIAQPTGEAQSRVNNRHGPRLQRFRRRVPRRTATGKTFEVEGTVDTKSQRAAWGPVGKDWPIMETGLYNLTENEAGALVHFDDGTTQQWLLTRLDEPKE